MTQDVSPGNYASHYLMLRSPSPPILPYPFIFSMDAIIDEEIRRAMAYERNINSDSYVPDPELVRKYHEKRQQIENNEDPSLTDLHMALSFFPHDNDWEGAGRAIGSNIHLKQLWMGSPCKYELLLNKKISIEKFEAFWRGVSNNSSIETLMLHNYDIQGGTSFFHVASDFLKRLKELDLSGNNIDDQGAVVLSEILSSPTATIEQFRLSFDKDIHVASGRESRSAVITPVGWKTILGSFGSSECMVLSFSQSY